MPVAAAPPSNWRCVMKKLRLDLDNIQVERFEVSSAEGEKGTV
jgi:hypothetical protein